MIPQSYNDIRQKVENLYDTSSPQVFLAICEAALGGSRGLDKQELMSAMMSGNKGLIHAILTPLVDELIKENRAEALSTSYQYQVKSIGDNEVRVKKTERDKYQRTTGDYIVNTAENICNCPESLNRLEKLFIPCKHQFLTNTPTTASRFRSLSKQGSNKSDTKILQDYTEECDKFIKGKVPKISFEDIKVMFICLADSLDQKGLNKEADQLDNFLKGNI